MSLSFVKYLSLLPSPDNSNLQAAINLYQSSDFLETKLEELCFPELGEKELFGKKILIKPNLVLDCRTPEDEYSLYTDINLILAMCEYVLKRNPGSLTIAEAPIQKCNWEKVTAPLRKGISLLELRYKKKIELIDLRKMVWNGYKPVPNPNKDAEYLIFDLGDKSCLDEICDGKKRFRVTNYDPERLAHSHDKGKHQYCIAKKYFDSDLVISMPKLKTHQKAGLTCALKILVGINGDKDILPHHRKGGVSDGGDCYPGASVFGWLAETFLDIGNHFPGKRITPICYWMADHFRVLMPHQPEISTEGNWYGNDTCWRMVMDLNTIAAFGRSDGTIADTPQRSVWSVADAIVGGQGKGPLNPDPLPMSTLIFSNNSYLMDWTVGHFWNLSNEKIPLLREAGKKVTRDQALIFWNGKKITESQLREKGFHPMLPPGWINYSQGE